MTEPKKQDGTMELDVGQIDLLDLPLPPRSKPTIEAAASAEEPRVSKGPPPLPPSAPPAAPAEEEPPVPSLALPSPSQPHPPAAISARSLAFGPPQKQKSPAVQLMIGMGGATVLCVVAFFAWRATHKTQPVAPAPSASAAPVVTQAFTMAPIEFTAPVTSGSAAPEETASAHAASSATPSATSTAKPTTTSHATSTPAGTTKPPRTDELIKVEN